MFNIGHVFSKIKEEKKDKRWKVGIVEENQLQTIQEIEDVEIYEGEGPLMLHFRNVLSEMDNFENESENIDHEKWSLYRILYIYPFK